MSRLLFVTMPITGHVTPGLPLARKLIERGHEVRWYTGSRFKERIEATGAKYLPMQAGFDFDDLRINDAFPGRGELKDLAQFKFDMMHVFADAGIGQLKDLQAIVRDYPADVVVADVASIGPAFLEELGGPPAAVFGVTALTFSSRDVAPFGLGMLPDASPLGRLRNGLLNRLVDGVVFRDINVHFGKVRAQVGLPPSKRGFLASSLPRYLFMQPTVPSFEYPRSDLPAQVHFVGPILPEPAASFTPPAWWGELRDKRRPVILVTQGTSATDAAQLIVPTLKALADLDALVIATTGGKDAASLELTPLPANARVEPFIPYDQLMPQVDLLITNGGYGGVQIALANGVPIIAAGTTEDKPEVSNRVAWSGVGLNLKTKTPEPELLRAAVNRVLADPQFRQRAGEIKAEIAGYDAAVLAANLIEKLAATRQPVPRPALQIASRELATT